MCQRLQFNFCSLHEGLYYILTIFIHCSFFVTKERTKKVLRLVKIYGFIACAKICTRAAATNKNFHGTRCAQTPGNFYCFSVNHTKFLMPRVAERRTWQLLFDCLAHIVG